MHRKVSSRILRSKETPRSPEVDTRPFSYPPRSGVLLTAAAWLTCRLIVGVTWGPPRSPFTSTPPPGLDGN